MKLRTELTPSNIYPALQPSDQVLMLGSCFAENIGSKLIRGGMSVKINPLGVQYNPLSIAQTLDYLSGVSSFDEQEVFEHLGLARHWDLHTRICAPTRSATIQAAHDAINEASQLIRDAQWLYLTLGTAHVWRYGSRVVSCCHKRPQHEFTRELLSVSEVVTTLQESIRCIHMLNPKLNVLITVSPVRYLRDGLVASQRSKATLLLAAHELVERINASYFPAYELVIDDLRDYRFFDRDLAHPSDLAIDYVWNALLKHACSTATQLYIAQNEKVMRQTQHRPHTSS